jgi:hypothetical protein
VATRHHRCAVSHESSFRYNTSVLRPRPTLVHPEGIEGPKTPSRTPLAVKGRTELEERNDGGVPGRAEHNLFVRRRRATPPTPRCWAGHCSDRVTKKPIEAIDGDTPERVEHVLIARQPSYGRGVAPLGAHRGGQPTRTRGNRGYPPPLREGRDPPTPRCRAGHIQPGSRRDHRGIDDGDTLERVEHALPAHRRVEQPRDRSPGHPPRWTAVNGLGQPRSPLTLARGSRSLRHRDAGRATLASDREQTHRRIDEKPIEVERRRRSSLLCPESTNSCCWAGVPRPKPWGAATQVPNRSFVPLPRVQLRGPPPEGRESLLVDGQEPRDDHPSTPTEMSASTTVWLGSEGPPLPRVSRAKSVPSPERSLEQSARCRHRGTPPPGIQSETKYPVWRPEHAACNYLRTTDDVPLRRQQMRG